MAEFRMPSLGADMEAGTLVEWLKRPGDSVKRGDIVAVVETQKGAIEVEIFEDGVVGAILVPEGRKVPVGTPLARIDRPGDPAASASAAAPAPPAPAPTPPAPERQALQPAPAPAVPADGLRASPAARRLAADRGLALEGLSGSGPEGAILLADVEAALAAGAPEGAPAQKPQRAGLDLAEMRKAIAAAMARSKREIPHYYLAETIDLTAALEFLERLNAERPPERRVLYAALLLRAVAVALRKTPELNGFMTPEGFAPSREIHIGTALAIRGGGLIAPAIHDVDRLGLDETMAALAELAGRAREGRLRSSEMTDPTITVSSLGERGAEALYGVIYPPQVALVGFGSPAERPWCVEGRVQARRILRATLAADHRASDGHRGALFLRRLGELLQKPETL